MRLSLLLPLWYVAAVASLGFLPFLSAWLTGHGWTAAGVAALMAALPLSFTLVGPLAGYVADRTGRPDVVLRIGAVVALAGMGLLLGGPAVWPVAVGYALVAVGRAPVNAIGDAVALATLGGDRRRYGAHRAWGSVAFLGVVLAAGVLADRYDAAPVALAAAATALLAALALLLPRVPVVPSPPLWHAVGAFARHRVLGLGVLLAVVHGATCAFYDDFFGVHVMALGHGSAVLGAALAAGVAVEVAVLFAGRRLLDGIGAGWLLLLGVGAGPLRWMLTALASSAAVLVAVQTLHGLTFAAYWVAMVALFSERAPKGLHNAAQGVLLGATFGAGRLVELVVAGLWLDVVGTRALFFAMAGVAVVATALATGVRARDAALDSSTGGAG